MNRGIILLLIFLTNILSSKAQNTETPGNDSLNKEIKSLKSDVANLNKLKVTGWIQMQYQSAETKGSANFDGGTFAPNSDQRFTIRRGRIKFTYNGKNTQYVMQINATERGINLTEIYAIATEPWMKTFSIAGGVMNRPFGFEIDQSSAVRESPERSRYSQILMPNERDMGAKIIIAPPASSKFAGFRIDAGFFNGQGVYVPGYTTPAGFPSGPIPGLGVVDFDSYKDFIGRMTYYKSSKNGKFSYGIGTSHYNGGNAYQNNRSYEEIQEASDGSKKWVAADTTNKLYKNSVAPRIYYGGEGFLSYKSELGTTTIRGEYITGKQSGTANSTQSPFFPPASQDTYVRNFNGFYGYFIHRIGKHEVAFKYEWYDPNTKVTGSDIRTGSGFTAADVKYEQYGFTYTFYAFENVKFMGHYTIQRNEATGLIGLTNDLKDNIFTLRMQYRF